MMKRNRLHGAGFTLVELLVVIVIIGMLLGLVFPALNGVKRRSYQAKCAANLKQIGGAIMLYAADNKRWPIGFDANAGTTDPAIWYHVIHPYMGGTSNLSYQTDSQRQREVLVCPAVKPVAGQIQMTYSAHPSILIDVTGADPVGLGCYPAFKRPSEIILMLDGICVPRATDTGGAMALFSSVPGAENAFTGDKANADLPVEASSGDWLAHNTEWVDANAGYPGWRHPDDTINTLRVDGHVESMSLDYPPTILQRNIMLNY